LTVARHLAKIMTWDEADAWRRDVSGSVVFTNGVFDLLHAGHVDVLAHARAQGDALIVGLNSDSSVRRLKGPDRPVRTEAERAYVLAALGDVDAVVTFSEDTPLALIRRLRPDVLVKGGDYEPATVVGRDDVESWGGRVVIVPLRPGQSTTSIIEKLRAPG
jgi:D-beta-D-heptose 7-phosphate kinase/D-beta-D-heptose 1-phosphate adenosyltransferase